MNNIKKDDVSNFVKNNIQSFHENRLKSLETTSLYDLLKKKNPYLFKAKNTTTAQELVTSFLDAKLSSSEEKIFGDFLESLAIFVAQDTLGASKSASHGIDFEYTLQMKRFLVSVKSGLNWGNSSQWKALENDFKTAVKVLKQSKHVSDVECILGICYGKAPTVIKKGLIQQICGQNFWFIVSGDKDFYIDIIEPLGYKAKELNDNFNIRKSELTNKFTAEFIKEFCNKNGKILWTKLVKFNSQNLTNGNKTNEKKQ